MMLRLLPWLLLFGLPTAHGQPLSAQVDSLFAAWDQPNRPGAAVAVMQRDSVLYMQGYGTANLEYDVPITPETVFMVASVSKQFTAFAIAMLAAQDAVDLDAEVRTYVPELHAFEPPITVRHLVHHTSGLRDEFGLLGMAAYHMDDVITKDTILNLLYRQRRLNFDPGEEYSYSNSGYTLMAEIVERVTEQSFREWTTRNIFAPLGMHDSHFRDNHTTVIKGRAQGYELQDTTYKSQPVAYSSVGASGLYTTAKDLTRWMNNLRTGQVGGPEVLNQIVERGVLNDNDTLTYAFGLAHGGYKGERRISHSGSHRGFKTHVTRFPDRDLAIIVLGNTEEFAAAAMALRVADLFFTDETERLGCFAGTYTSEELHASWEVVVDGRRLVMINRHGERVPLQEVGRNAFRSDAWYMVDIVFQREGEAVTGFTASNSRTREVAFRRQ